MNVEAKASRMGILELLPPSSLLGKITGKRREHKSPLLFSAGSVKMWSDLAEIVMRG